MILFFLGFTFINFLSLAFNALLFYVIYKQTDKTKQPSIYIYTTIIANSIDSITLFLSFLLPILMDDKVYLEFRHSFGSTLTFLCTFSYEYTFYLTILLVIHRIHAVKEPASKFFTNRKIWTFCGGILILPLIILVIPFLSNCPVNINQRAFSFQVNCSDLHPITQFDINYLIVIPVITMIMNICLVLYLAQKRGEALRRRRLNVVSISSTSNVHQLPPLVLRSKTRQSFDKSLLLQSVYTTSFLLIYELTGLLLKIFKKDYESVSVDFRRFVFYSRISVCSMLCFMVYFIGIPSIRKLIIAKIVELYKKKPAITSPTTTVLV